MPDKPEYIQSDTATALGFAHDSEPKLDRYGPFCFEMHLILADQLADIPDIDERLRCHLRAIQEAWCSIKTRKVCPFEANCPKAPGPRYVQLTFL